MAERVASMGNPNFILIQHGKLAINVPLSVFKGRRATFREPQASEFFEMLMSRYPWLTVGAIEEIKREAKEAMRSLIELEEDELASAQRLLEEGRPTEALHRISAYLKANPKDADAIQLKGRIQFALGEKKEGYRSFAEASKAEGPSRRRISRGR